jgi:hypothetical protein
VEAARSTDFHLVSRVENRSLAHVSGHFRAAGRVASDEKFMLRAPFLFRERPV